MKLSFPKLKINKRTWLAILAVVVLALAASFYFFRGESPEAEAGWWNEEWNYRKKLTIDATKIDADLTDFPVAVVLTTSNFTYANAQTNGEDIRFTDLSGNTLYHEIEKWNSSATSTIWVKIPQVDDTVDTIFYMYYGNGLATDGQNKTAVWDDGFAAVYHLSETTGDHFDSTKYDNNTTYTNAETQGSYAGVLDGADFFNGTYHQVPADTSLDIVTSSISMWVRPETPGKYYNVILAREGAGSLSTIFINDTRNFCIWYYDGFTCGSYQFATGTWTHVVVETTAPDNVNLYINGQYNSSISQGFINTPGSYLAIANRPGYPVSYIGALDEIRIQNTVRSAAWHKASYENGLNNLITLAAEEKGPGPVAYWAFDEGYGTSTSETANANDGTIYGATWKDETECVKGKCLYFDGTNDYVESIGNMGITGNSPRTVSMWFKQNSFANKIILAFGTGGDTQLFEVELGTELGDESTLIGHFYGLGNDTITGAPTFKLNEWNHAVITYDGTKADVYLNGQYANSKTISLNTGNSSVRIGRGIYQSNAYFNGFLDEVKVYDYARSADQVKVDYNRGLSLVLGGNQYASLSDGLIGWWKMDEASWNGTSNEVIDHSGNANHGTAGGGANTTSTAQFARAGYFDGDNDVVTLADNDNTDLSEAITISAWVRQTTTGGWDYVVSRGYFDNAYSFGIYSTNLIAYINGNMFWDQSTVLATNQWYHIAFTYDRQATSDNVKLYLNGVNISRWNYSQPIETNVNFDTFIGADYNLSSSYNFNGMIDEVRMYNRALSSDEVRRLSEWAPEPVGYWKFDEGTGETAYDSTASSTGSGGNHGTLHASMTEASWVRGKYGSALNFDGTNNLVTVDSEKLTIDHGSISAWINWTGESGFTYNIAAKAVDTSGYVFGVVDNKLKFHCHNNPLGAGGYYAIDFSSTNNIPQNQWTHVAVTFQHASGSTAYLYINGQQVASSSMVANCLAPSSGDFTIGDSSATGLYWGKWQGMIDDVKVYNYTRNQRQILEDMNAGRQNNPIGYWSFDEEGGQIAKDYSGYGYDLILGTSTAISTDDPTRTKSGKNNSALQFDGVNDYIQASSEITAYNFGTNDFSASFYVKYTDAKDYGALVGQGYLSADVGWGFFYDSTGKIYFQTRNGADISQIVSDKALNDGQWHHIVGRRENGTMKMYVDGNLQSSINSTVRDLSGGDGIFSIGARNEISLEFYSQATIDEVKVYNYVLTLDEIRQNYNVGQQIVLSRSANDNLTDGLLAYWPMDGNLTDFSGNGNTGSATGATVTSSAKFGQAYAIGGGTNYISVPTSDSLDSYTDKLTVSGWYYFNTLPSPQSWLFDKGNNYYLRVSSVGGFTNYLVGIDNADYWSTQSGLVTAGRWYYVVFTYDGQERKIYVDGQLKASRKDTGNISTGGTFNIGNRNSHIEPMDGQVDDIKVYNRTLSADEIAQNYVTGPKPVAYWKMDEASWNGTANEVIDSSGNGLHGESTGSGTNISPLGKYGSAGYFDGNNYLDFGNPTGEVLDPGMRNFTFATWIKTSNTANARIFEKRAGGYDGFEFGIGTGGNWMYFIGDYTNRSWSDSLGTAGILSDDQWHHVAYVVDRTSSIISFYKDGVLNTTSSISAVTGHVSSTANFILGTGFSNDYIGKLDDVRIYNYARTQRQILEDMNASSRIKPIAYWKMDEGEGTVIHDYSGNSLNGTLMASTTGNTVSTMWSNGLAGKINGSLDFDGIDDSFYLPDNPTLSAGAGKDFTWSFWMKPDTTGDDQFLLVKSQDTSYKDWLIFYDQQKIRFYYENGSDVDGPCNWIDAGCGTVGSVAANEWTYVTVTYDSQTRFLRFYINGKFDNQVTLENDLPDTTGLVYVGQMAYYYSPIYSYGGQLDEIKIFNYVLTPAEVKNEYNGGFSSYFR